MAIPEPGMPRFTSWLRPVVDAVARVNCSIHRKLLFGFLTGALLLVGMGGLGLVVIDRMNGRVVELNRLEVKSSRAHQMLYAVTAQSHYRAMALLTKDDSYNQSIAAQKLTFVGLLDAMERDDPADAAVLARMRTDNDTYNRSSAAVQSLYEQRDFSRAQNVHLSREHQYSHVLEASLGQLIKTADGQMRQARAAVRSGRTFFTAMVVTFSATSVAVALVLGFLLSWAIVLPVRKMERALAGVTAGDFAQRIQVPNRDEFGQLTRDLNSTSARLAAMFEDQRRLARRLGETNESLERASEAKSRFLASVSHELRTPMNAILGFTDALLAGVDGPLNDEQKASLGWVQRGGRELLGLINEVLDLSKIEAGKLTIDAQPFDPRELVESIVVQYRSLAAQKGVLVTWRDSGTPPEVALDRQRVRQILVNLVGNALKFTREGEVEVVTGGAGDGALHVAVRDTGPGIPPDEHEAIFEEFRQGEGAHTGTGLGLAISRRLARMMGGEVTLESEHAHGSTFHLNLPLTCRTEPQESGIAEPAPAGDGERVLLSVDDDPSVAPLLQKMLAGHGYRVSAARTASGAVGEARRLQPVAILLDILMPEVDGYAVLRELKSDPATCDIPVIMVSVVDAADGPEVAEAHVSKPIRQDALLRALADVATGQRVEN